MSYSIPITRLPTGLPTEIPSTLLSNGAYNAFGTTIMTPDGDYLIYYREGTSHIAGGIIKVIKSTDGGATWTAPVTQFSASNNLQTVSGGITKNGKIILIYSEWEGSTFYGMFQVESIDNGVTFTSPVSFSNGAETSYENYGGLISIGDGKIAIPWYGFGASSNSYIAISADEGATWTSYVILTGGANTYNETSIVYLGGQYILAVARNESDPNSRQALSSDNGLTWTNIGDITAFTSAQTPVCLATFTSLSGRRVIVCYYSDAGSSITAIYANPLDLINNGVGAWKISTKTVVGIAGKYPSIIHPNERVMGIGFFWAEISAGVSNLYFVITPKEQTIQGVNVFVGDQKIKGEDLEIVSANAPLYAQFKATNNLGDFFGIGTNGSTIAPDGILLAKMQYLYSTFKLGILSVGDTVFANGTSSNEVLRLLSTYILASKPINISAGTGVAGTAPLKLTSGTLNTTAEAGAVEYNGSHYATKGSGLRYVYGGGSFDHFNSVGNTGTGEDDLYSDTTPANSLAVNGEKISAEYGGTYVSSGTATRQIKVYFAGTVIFDTGALTLSLSSAWTVYVSIIRVSSTVVRYMVSFATQGAALSAYTSVGELTGLTLSNTNILKITGEAAGVGAATNDIIVMTGNVRWDGASSL